MLGNGKHPRICPACGFEWYDNQKPSVTLVIENNAGEVLLVKRNRDPHKGKWVTPGGFVEFRETAEAAARREIREELGVKLSSLRYLATLSTPYPYRGVAYRLLEIVFQARLKKGKVKPTDDAADARWFGAKTVPYARMAFSTQRRFLRSYFRAR